MDLQLEDHQVFIPEFRGNKKLPEDQQIKVNLRPLTLGHFMDIMDAMDAGDSKDLQMIPGPNGVMVPKVTTAQVKRMVTASAAILPEYVSIENLKVKGEAITVNDVTSRPVFMTLAQEIIMALMTLSMPTEEETKN